MAAVAIWVRPTISRHVRRHWFLARESNVSTLNRRRDVEKKLDRPGRRFP
jgi:hypothetical protein